MKDYKITKRVGEVTLTLETDDRELAESFLFGDTMVAAPVMPALKEWPTAPRYKDTGE